MVRSLLFFTSIGLSLLLMVWSHKIHQEYEAARNWVPTPCEFMPGSSLKSVKFSYEYEGVRHEGNKARVFEISGLVSGDDEAWLAWLEKAVTHGSNGVCYVNPDDSRMAVLDRRHAHGQPRNIVLFAHIFLIIPIWIGFRSLFSRDDSPSQISSRNVISAIERIPVPRHLPWFRSIRLVFGHNAVLFFGLATATSALVFAIMGGPDSFDWLSSKKGAIVNGQVLAVGNTQKGTSFFMSTRTTQIIYSFEWDNMRLVGEGMATRYPGEDSLRVGSGVSVCVVNDDPSLAEIESGIGDWFALPPSWIAGAVGLFFACCLASAIAGECLIAWLFPFAKAGLAIRRPVPVSDLAGANNGIPMETWFVRVGDHLYPVDPRTSNSIKQNNAPALYSPKDPNRNGALDQQRADELLGNAAHGPMINLLFGHLYVLILTNWLLGIRCFAGLVVLAVVGWFFLSARKREPPLAADTLRD
ncbi:MAG: hypothetical protein ACKO26_12875 [Planctomycetota bacterium]